VCDIERLCVILNDNIMTNYVLKMYICKDDAMTSEQHDMMKEWYLNAILKHNKHIEEALYPDAGFDLFVPNEYFVHDVTGTSTVPLLKVNMKVVCAMYKQMYCGGEDGRGGEEVVEIPVGYTMYPRSSLSKTPLRMANSVGVIDSGYRGPLLGAFDVLGNLNTMGLGELLVEEKQRLVQVCHPGLEPFRVVLVDRLDDLGITSRGNGGFGSTGK